MLYYKNKNKIKKRENERREKKRNMISPLKKNDILLMEKEREREKEPEGVPTEVAEVVCLNAESLKKKKRKRGNQKKEIKEE